MTTVVCPGSFDPMHNGHLDVIERAAGRFDHVVVAVVENPSKQGLLTIPERQDLIAQVTGHLGNVTVDRFQGLLVDFCSEHDIGVICKGLRAVSDFEYEVQMAQMNLAIGDIETVFMATSPEWAYVSSSLVKEVARLGGTIDGTVPEPVAIALLERLGVAASE